MYVNPALSTVFLKVTYLLESAYTVLLMVTINLGQAGCPAFADLFPERMWPVGGPQVKRQCPSSEWPLAAMWWQGRAQRSRLRLLTRERTAAWRLCEV